MDSGESRNGGGDDVQCAFMPTQGIQIPGGGAWIPAKAGMTEGMKASLQGLDEVAHLPERWATRSF